MNCIVQGVRSSNGEEGVIGGGKGGPQETARDVLVCCADAGRSAKAPIYRMGTSNKETTMDYEHRTNVLA